MRYVFLALLTFLFSVTGSYAQKTPDKFDWRDGTIIDNQYKYGVKSEDGPDMASPNPSQTTKASYSRDDTETITVEGEGNIFVVRRSLFFIWQKRIKLSDPEKVKYAIRDNILYLQNHKGKKVTYEILEKKPKT